MYATTSDSTTFSSTMGNNCHSSPHYHSHIPSIHSRIVRDAERIQDKFRFDTLVQLENGNKKTLQQITSNDLLSSITLNSRYSGLLARIDYIGSVDKMANKAELRFSIHGLGKVGYYVREEMPFFVQQYSCWSSISPEQTRRICGLKTRQLECGDWIFVLTDQDKTQRKPDYTQRSPTKCLVERYINEKISSTTDHPLSTNKRMKFSKD